MDISRKIRAPVSEDVSWVAPEVLPLYNDCELEYDGGLFNLICSFVMNVNEIIIKVHLICGL
jgi:hypothetical protein